MRIEGDATPSTTGLAAVLFDMDGLLVDTEPQWFAAESRTVAALGGSWGPEQQLALVGSNLEFAADYMLRHTGSDHTRETVMRILQDNMTAEFRSGVTFRPGAERLLAHLKEQGVALAMVTSSVRAHVDIVLQHFDGQPFDHVVTADDVSQLKPHPEPYQLAMELLEVAPNGTVVLEDSPAGIASAEAAGCHVVAVPSVVPIEPSPGRTVVATLERLDVSVLQRLLTRS